MIESYDTFLKNRSTAIKPYYFFLQGNFTIPASSLPMPQVMSSIGIIGQDNTGPGPIQNISTHQFEAMKNERLILYDVQALSAPVVDGYLAFKVDNIDENINFGPVSVLLPSFYHRGLFSFKPIQVGPNSSIAPIFRMSQSGVSNSTSTVSVQFYFVSVPTSYNGEIMLPQNED